MSFNLASLARPYFGAVMLTVILLTAGGIYSATLMPSGVYPEVTFPRIAVVARVPGLAVPNMEVQVTQPLEQAVSGVLGVAQVRSKTIRGGSELSIDFNPGTDMRRAEQLTWNRIGAVRSQLPADSELTVEQMTPSIFPILSLVLTGGDNPSQLRDYAFYNLAPRIKNVPDVLYANVAGGDVREIEVIVRPEDLLAAGLSAADLADQIGKVHRLQPVGRIERPPFAYQIIINTQGQTARDIEDLVISAKGNTPLRVADVADVKVMNQDRVLSIGYEGKDAVVITIFRRLGGNTVNVSRDVRELVAKIKKPKSIQTTFVYDQAAFVTAAVDNVRDAIIVGGLFSVLILLAFLRSWRATLISALAIPTTLAITFLFLHWTGETLNLMSLGGLAVAIGLIIDDTVVVIENIARHLTPGQPGADKAEGQAVDAASVEITGAVVGSTLTTVLVFVPLAFIAGVYGQFFASLSWALCIAVLVSMVISLTLVPVCAAKFLAGKPMPPPGRIYNKMADAYEWMLAFALRFPRSTLVLSFVAVGVVLLLLFTGIPDWRKRVAAPVEAGATPAAPMPLVKGLETGLMPAMDEGAFTVDYLAPGGTPLSRSEEMARKIEDVLTKNPDVDAYVRRTGAEMGIFATQTNRGDIQVVLRPAEESLANILDPVGFFRKPRRPPLEVVEAEMKERGTALAAKKYGKDFTEEQMWAEGKQAIRQKYRRRSMREVMAEVEDEVKDIFTEHQLKIDPVPIMQDELGDLSGANKPVEVKLFGPDHGTLRKIGTDIGEMLEKRGKGRGIKEVSSIREGNPDLMIQIDGVRAARLNLAPDQIERQLKAIYQGQIAGQVRESALRITDVRVRYPNNYRYGTDRFDPELLLNQLLLLPPGDVKPGDVSGVSLSGPNRTIPLFALATLDRVRTPDEQWRENQQPAVFVSAELNEEEAGLGSVVADIRRWMNDISIPADYRWEMGGHYLRQQEAFHSLFVVMVVAAFLVFIMLAFQFHSVVLPMLIFLTQPLSLVSGLLALRVTGTPLNISSYMGAILLVGLDMKNGILLVEYIQQLRREGMELRPALLLAGRTRFRPILMTSLAAILGLLPLAFGIGPGSQMQQPLAIMVIGGLTANTLFTRMIIPVGYLVLEGKQAKPRLV